MLDLSVRNLALTNLSDILSLRSRWLIADGHLLRGYGNLGFGLLRWHGILGFGLLRWHGILGFGLLQRYILVLLRRFILVLMDWLLVNPDLKLLAWVLLSLGLNHLFGLNLGSWLLELRLLHLNPGIGLRLSLHLTWMLMLSLNRLLLNLMHWSGLSLLRLSL